LTGIKGAVNQALGRWGYRIERTSRDRVEQVYSDLFAGRRVPDVSGLLALASGIPGMLSEESARILFALCYAQEMKGDVVEVGSWQGYSTSFLARAVAETGNGRMYAIDHFRGNAGKEPVYAAGQADLGDLPGLFRDHMRKAGLAETVQLLAMPNEEAAAELRRDGARIRFLFIDGDHSPEGVRRDIDLFFPMLLPGAIVVFDDCTSSAPGVIEAVDDLLEMGICETAFSYPNTVVAIARRGA